MASVPLKEGDDTPDVEPFIVELFDTLTLLDTPFQEVLKRLEKLRIKAFSSQ